MNLVDRQPSIAETETNSDVEALIREAKQRERRRRLIWLAVIVIVAGGGISAVVISVGGGSRLPSSVEDSGQPRGAIAAPPLEVRWRTKVSSGVISMLLSDHSLWVTGFGSVTRIDPTTGKVIAHISTPLTRELADIASLDGTIWVSSGHFSGPGGVLYEIGPTTNRVLRTVPAPGQPSAMTSGDGYLWVDVYQGGPELRPFDPRTNKFLGPVVSTTEQLGLASHGLGSVWLTSSEPLGRIWRINPTTMTSSLFIETNFGAAVPNSVIGMPTEVTIAGGSVWITFLNSNEIDRVDPATGRLQKRFFVTKTSGAVLRGTANGIWLLLEPGSSSPTVYDPTPSEPGRIGRLDTLTNRFVGTDLRIGDSAGYDSFVVAQHGAWVGDFLHSTVIAIAERR